MARVFLDTSSEYLENTSAVLTAEPIAMVCWAWTDNGTANKTILSLGSSLIYFSSSNLKSFIRCSLYEYSLPVTPPSLYPIADCKTLTISSISV